MIISRPFLFSVEYIARWHLIRWNTSFSFYKLLNLLCATIVRNDFRWDFMNRIIWSKIRQSTTNWSIFWRKLLFSAKISLMSFVRNLFFSLFDWPLSIFYVVMLFAIFTYAKFNFNFNSFSIKFWSSQVLLTSYASFVIEECFIHLLIIRFLSIFYSIFILF